MSSRTRIILAVTLIVGAAACSDNDADATGAGTDAAPTTATPSSVTPISATGRADCDHGTCLGPLDAGTYITTTFQPAITYTVGDGWTNGEDEPGNFLLQLDGDNRYIGIYRDVTVPFGCAETPEPRVGVNVDDIIERWTTHPGINATEPEPVNVGGLDGIKLDVGLDPTWTTACPFSDGEPAVPIIIGTGLSHLMHVLTPGYTERIYLLDTGDGGNVAIEIGPEGTPLDDYLTAVDPIIDQLTFSTERS